MIYDPSILQDYTEAFKQHSNSRFLDLFQSRYVHSLIVSLTRNEKNIAFLVVAPFPLKTRLISLLYQLKWFRLELGWCYWYSLEGTMPLLLIQALYSMKLVIKLMDFRIASIVNNNIKKIAERVIWITGLWQVFQLVLGLYQWLSSRYLTLNNCRMNQVSWLTHF